MGAEGAAAIAIAGYGTPFEEPLGVVSSSRVQDLEHAVDELVKARTSRRRGG